ncbi:YqzL family protein [Fodinisporobacter ferrooxydans]|uniref:YqzL family protein n=1 Tax=Fodinisporobacter ferrooxydans TaxID=2901836 RepID=A0ABY4CEY8_9BACL|nr:YqzL family protein [Alicyclobacillaceae bacterium MYW30-H2]
MRDFSWNVFAKTGEINAYLLYKDLELLSPVQQMYEGETEDQESSPSD